MNAETNLCGFHNVLIEGERLGWIVWESDTGLIDEVRTFGSAGQMSKALLEYDMPVTWMNGMDNEAYPAIIDMHVHDRFGQPQKEVPVHLKRACHNAGVSTIYCMGNYPVPFTRLEQLGELNQRWEGSGLTVFHNICASTDNLDVIRNLPKNVPGLGQVKMFMTSSTNPNTLIRNYADQVAVAEATRDAMRILLVHVGDEEILERATAEVLRQKGKLRISDHYLIRPPELEIEGIKRAIEICRQTKVRLHICHVSTALGLGLIADAKQQGLPITCETCPHYWLMHDRHLDILGGKAKMNPALRSREDMEAMKQAVCDKYSAIDLVASDHASHTEAEKDETEYKKCPSGVPGVDTTGLLTYHLKSWGKMSAKRFTDLTSRNAARILGLNKGELKPGYDADIMLIDSQGQTLFLDESIRSKCGWTPFHGTTVQGSIKAVVLGGKIVKNELV